MNMPQERLIFGEIKLRGHVAHVRNVEQAVLFDVTVRPCEKARIQRPRRARWRRLLRVCPLFMRRLNHQRVALP